MCINVIFALIIEGSVITMNKEECAKEFVNAIKTMAAKPENLDNFECYLSHHFDTWVEKFANTPENIASELKYFAEMKI